jgi:hypothetical protein
MQLLVLHFISILRSSLKLMSISCAPITSTGMVLSANLGVTGTCLLEGFKYVYIVQVGPHPVSTGQVA